MLVSISISFNKKEHVYLYTGIQTLRSSLFSLYFFVALFILCKQYLFSFLVDSPQPEIVSYAHKEYQITVYFC